MDLVAPVVTPVVGSIMEVIKRHVGYLVSSTNNVNEMRRNMNELNAMASDIKTKEETNVANDLVVPHYVPSWLIEVEKISEKVGNIPSGGTGCFNMKARYKAGKRSSDILKDIESLKKQKSDIKWSDEPRPLGKVRSTRPSTSESVTNDIDTQNVIKSSRELMFDVVMKALEPNNKSQMLALCGLGGVGKTTMMEQLKKVAEDKKMFDWIVKVVIGENKNQIKIQEAVAVYIGQPLTENDKDIRAERLHKRFEAISDGGKKKILVILDDLWEKMDLEDIGLTTPLPKGLKLLLTSRDERFCTQTGVEPSCIFRIALLENREAKKVFWETAGIDPVSDHDLIRIAEAIVKKCGGLPLAIKTIASALRDNKDKETWKDALNRFQNKHNSLLNIFEISYDNLKDDDEKSTFLLSGLFPDDHDIRIEDLTRYGWGLKLFKDLDSISAARSRVNACVGNLIRSNLLIESDTRGRVQIHDLIRDFVLRNFSNVKQASLVNNDNISDQLRKDSYERLLLKCGGMVDFPADFNHPNLALLNLMDGKKLTKFPEDFYTKMEKLKVVAYEGIHKPLLPRHSTTLRTLCLDSCKLMDDISFLGDLVKLEVLSFASCGISYLPSAIGKLKRLQLLDLTGCVDLCVDDGVFQSLDKLLELYMRASYGKPYRFTEDSCEGLKKVSCKLIAFEVEFFENILKPKNVSFKKLERFRISMGDQLGGFTSENTLKLEASCQEILECEIYELFEKTEELELQCVTGMSSLKDISERLSQYSFYNLKIQRVCRCADLTFIFTVNVVSNLTKLESLTVSGCPLLESLVECENNGANKAIKFQKLKLLKLYNLPMFVRLCDGDAFMELPQLMELILCDLPNVTSIFSKYNEISAPMQLLLNTKVLIPKLEILRIDRMDNLKEIWCDNTNTSSCSLEEAHNISMLRWILVGGCKSMVNLFSRNPMRLLTHLQTLDVSYCYSIEVLFNIDLGSCVCKIENVNGSSSSSSSLRNIHVCQLANLREVWRIKGEVNNSGIIIREFQGVESLIIKDCDKFRSIFTPTTIYFDLGALKDFYIRNCGQSSELLKDSQKQEIIPVVAIPSSSLLHQFPDIELSSYGAEVVFEIKSQSQSSRDLVSTKPNQLPCKLRLMFMNTMTHVWKCNWNEFFICQNQHPKSLLFHNITTIKLDHCKSVKYLFSPLMATMLSNLKKVKIESCFGMEEVVSNRDDDKEDENGKMAPSTYNNTLLTPTTLFPHLDSFTLDDLPILKHVGGGIANVMIHDLLKVPQVGLAYWSLCLYSREIRIIRCNALSSVIPSYTTRQTLKVEVMHIAYCHSINEVFASSVEINNRCHSEAIGASFTSRSLPRLGNVTAHKLSNLKMMHIINCKSLEYVFTFSTLESLKKLKEIRIKGCKSMKVIVREEDEEDQTTIAPNNKVVVVFPHVEVIELISLSNLEGFFLKIKEFEWPLLNEVVIKGCPKMTAFTCSKSIAPRLKYMEHPIFGKLSPEHYNFYMRGASPQTPSPSLDSTGSCPAISNEEIPRSLQDIKELNMENADKSEVIIAFNDLLHLQNLEKIHAKRCLSVKEMFEVALDVTNGEFNNGSQTIVKLPKLREMELEEMRSLKYLWQSNQWRQLELPNLTRLNIHKCFNIKHVFTTSMVGSLMQLQELHLSDCMYMKEIVKEEENYDGGKKSEIMFPNLRRLYVHNCCNLVPVFTSSMVGSFKQLQELHVTYCSYMLNEIVKEDDDCERKVLPCLKSLKLEHLQRLKGFCLWDKDFELPSLSTLVIKQCPELSVFTNGFVATPMLKVIETNEGLIDVGEHDINSFIITNKKEGRHF